MTDRCHTEIPMKNKNKISLVFDYYLLYPQPFHQSLPVVNGLGIVPVGSIPTNNLKNKKKMLVLFLNAISTTVRHLKELPAIFVQEGSVSSKKSPKNLKKQKKWR